VKLRVHHRWESKLPADDDHPFRTGAWRPNLVEYDADELDVLEGRIPDELAGTYLRNTENPLLPSIGRYHPFDGDGMLHAIRFAGGRARYRNRMVRTKGLAAELQAGAPLWAGIIEPPASSVRADGWGARTRMKDASSTDVVVHAGKAITSFYQCGDAYQLDLDTLDTLGAAAWAPPWGVSAHTKVDETTGELFWFAYSAEAPYLRVGRVDRDGRAQGMRDVPLPGPRLPHDLAFTERFLIVNDLPLYWDPAEIARGVYRPRFHRDVPSRFGIVPRGCDPNEPVRWFEAAPTYVLHWINAFERGDEVVLDGFFQADPTPRPDPKDGPYAGVKKMTDLTAMGARPHRWRFDLRTGRTIEEPLADALCEFPTIDGRRGGRAHDDAIALTAVPGAWLFDGMVRLGGDGGVRERYRFPDGVYGSEAPIAGEFVVTFTIDTVRDSSECQIFRVNAISQGPIARVALPERICAGTHACWAPL
jgi:carotenoid cleavage dioxygenase